ncbi:unnamed protein product, partial [Scytosiphon promiscuus]
MLKPLSTQEYLEETHIIDYQNPSIVSLANKFKSGCHIDVEVAKALFELVRDDIDHSFDINANGVTISASEVLGEGHGICYAKSHLLAALRRACGIPSG